LLVLGQLITYEMAVYGIAAFMGIEAGYNGGTLSLIGFGQVVITQVISWIVIPIGTLVVIALISTVTGLVNVVTARSDLPE
jgi:hypothetical protein